MEPVNYYLSTNKKWFADFASSLASHTGEAIRVEGNSLILSPSVGEGRFEFYELSEGISILLVDCVYKRKLKLQRTAVPGTDYYKIFFNASNARLVIEKNSGRYVDTGSDLSEAILCTSNSLPVSFAPPVGSRVRDIELIFHRNWANKHIPEVIPEQAEMIRRMKAGKMVQFTATIDLNCLDIINEILETKMDSAEAFLYVEGLVLQLFSTFIKNIIDEQIGEHFAYNSEYERITKFVEKQEQNLDLKLPSLEEAAVECNMGRSKFVSLFTSYYKESYGSFFIKMRLHKAYEMLQQDRSVTDVVHSVGYSNIGNFIKSFKVLFGISPKQAQKMAKQKRVDERSLLQKK